MRDFVVDNDLTASDPKEVEIYADKRLLKGGKKKMAYNLFFCFQTGFTFRNLWMLDFSTGWIIVT